MQSNVTAGEPGDLHREMPLTKMPLNTWSAEVKGQ